MTQIKMSFENKKLFGVHDLRYHLLRVGNAEMSNSFWHINSVWEGYNSNGYPKKEMDQRLSKYRFAESESDIRKILTDANTDSNEHATYYIMAKNDCYENMPEYKS